MNVHSTDPNMADTDEDGLDDSAELNVHNTNPLEADTDQDGLTDGEEVQQTQTDPTLADSDNDGLDDLAEVNVFFTNPTAQDTDGGGVEDGAEVNAHGTNPKNADDDDSSAEGQTMYATPAGPPDAPDPLDQICVMGVEGLFAFNGDTVKAVCNTDSDGQCLPADYTLPDGAKYWIVRQGFDNGAFVTPPGLCDQVGGGFGSGPAGPYGFGSGPAGP